MSEPVAKLLEEYAELQMKLSDPAVHANPLTARRLGRRYTELGGIVEAHKRARHLEEELQTARELAAEDEEFADLVPDLQRQVTLAQERVRSLLIPRDPHDGRNVILEVKAGEGGEESALFAADLVRMYTRYADLRGWKTEIVSANESDLGGYKDIQLALKGSAQDPAQGVYASLKFEGGVHRVQRVPVTESQGRIHTSAAGVLVFPEVDAPEEIEINQQDLKIDVYRSSGPGGQSVNTTDSAVRITHLPTGIVVAMQNEKSQLQNREAGLRVLRARLLAHQQEQRDAENAQTRKAQIHTMDRSERIRTYNFPENRVSDHRTGYKSYNLDAVMNGELTPIIQSAIDMDEQRRLNDLAV